MSMITVQVAEEGRIVIPAEVRQKMGIRVGDHIALSWSDGSPELRLPHVNSGYNMHLNWSNNILQRLIPW
ncbi:MAG: AbrB/MazE/SpoVT family DNA-binding domain-containing protein [Methylococcales bacterium]